MNKKLLLCSLLLWLNSPITFANNFKFAPPDNKVLVFVGQDNKSVGGTKDWQQGYVDKVGLPSGVTHYVYVNKGKSNAFGYTFSETSIDGLNGKTTWGAGPMCFTCYLESDKLTNTMMHLSLSMEFGAEAEIARGQHDDLLDELVTLLKSYQNRPFLIRIGYEFDGEWNGYNPKYFKQAWRRIVDELRRRGLNNFATVFASSTYDLPKETWFKYWPGDEYVDWLGYSYWGFKPTLQTPAAIEIAREKHLPVFIAEATPRGIWLNKADGNLIWQDWFIPMFQHIEAYSDVIKAVSYINAHWDDQPMWEGWGDSRIEKNQTLTQHWLNKMAEPQYIHGDKKLLDLVNFKITNTKHPED